MRRFLRKMDGLEGDEEMRQKQIKRLQGWLLLLAGFLILANIFVELVYHSGQPAGPEPVGETREPISPKEKDQTIAVIRGVIKEFNVPNNQVRQNDDSIFAAVPQGFRFLDFYFHLNERLQSVDGAIVRTIEDQKKDRIELTVAVDGKPALKIVLAYKASLPAVAGRVAILIDDFGYSYNEVVKKFIFFPEPLTLSIIPGLDETARVAREAKLASREVLVHMPMEALNEPVVDNGFTILVNQDRATTRLRIRQAFAEMPGAVGMNNHQGSRATADREVMKTVLTEIKNQKKIFIDSYTSPSSIALGVARSLQVPSARNLLFIDAEDDADFIEKQLQRLADASVKQGQAIGIGHVRKKTLEVMQRVIPEMKSRGIEFVTISQLL